MVLLCVMVLCVMVVLWMTVLLHVHDGQVVMAGSLHLQGGPHATLPTGGQVIRFVTALVHCQGHTLGSLQTSFSMA